MTTTNKSNQPIVLAARRTVVGRFLGGLSRVSSPEIGSWAIQAAVEDSGVDPAAIDECVMGCVLQAGVGQNPSRQAGLRSYGLPTTLSVTFDLGLWQWFTISHSGGTINLEIQK